MNITHEQLSADFQKWLLIWAGDGKKYFHAVLHHFTGKDKGGPHSHPWDFTSHVLAGGYVERQYIIKDHGDFETIDYHRQVGDVFNVQTDTIHEIIDLPEGEAWTIVIPTSPAPVPWHFWNFGDEGIYKRLPGEEFERVYFPLKYPNGDTMP